MDYSPLFISLKTAAMATAVTFFLGIAAAYWVIKRNKTVKGIFDGLFTLPMILPPTVVGFFLLKIFGVNGPVGKMVLELFDTKIVFSWSATVIASSVVAFPLMYRTARGAFEQMDPTLIYSAQTLGLPNTVIFWRVIVPNCKHGIIAGAILAFARALGEFGATMMLAGNLPGKTQTISTAVYSLMAAGNETMAYRWVVVNLVISFTAMLLLNVLSSGGRPRTL